MGTQWASHLPHGPHLAHPPARTLQNRLFPLLSPPLSFQPSNLLTFALSSHSFWNSQPFCARFLPFSLLFLRFEFLDNYLFQETVSIPSPVKSACWKLRQTCCAHQRPVFTACIASFRARTNHKTRNRQHSFEIDHTRSTSLIFILPNFCATDYAYFVRLLEPYSKPDIRH